MWLISVRGDPVPELSSFLFMRASRWKMVLIMKLRVRSIWSNQELLSRPKRWLRFLFTKIKKRTFFFSFTVTPWVNNPLYCVCASTLLPPVVCVHHKIPFYSRGLRPWSKVSFWAYYFSVGDLEQNEFFLNSKSWGFLVSWHLMIVRNMRYPDDLCIS